MASGIEKADPEKGQNVQSVTEEVPSDADATSAPSPTEGLDVNRPPVSTNRPDVPIAHSLVAGAGAPTGEPEYNPEEGTPEPAEPEKRGPGRPRKEESEA